MKQDVILINTAREGPVGIKELMKALENKMIGGYCTDVLKKEKGFFLKDNSKDGINDEQLKRLLSFSNVLLTPHQAFVTEEALENIAEITFENIASYEEGKKCKIELGLELISS